MPSQLGREFGDFLRTRREALRPEVAGLPPGRRRRTPGLRREEVAELAGIGVDWYVRLEQGRAVRPSVTTIDALARALCLNRTERAHLTALALSGRTRAFEAEVAPEPLRRLVEALNVPAYVAGRRRDLIVWNEPLMELVGDLGERPAEDRNMLVIVLTDPRARALFGAGWQEEARRMVAQFRIAYDHWAGDSMFESLVARLSRECPQFASWWANHEIRAPAAGMKTLNHPTLGQRRYFYSTFDCQDDCALKLAIFAPAV